MILFSSNNYQFDKIIQENNYDLFISQDLNIIIINNKVLLEEINNNIYIKSPFYTNEVFL